VTANGTVTANGDIITGCLGSGIHIEGARSTVNLIGTRISACAGAAIICEEGTSSIHRTILNGNLSGAIFGPDAAVEFINNTVVAAPAAVGRGIAVNGRQGSGCYNNIVVGYSVGFFLEESPVIDYNCTFGNQGYNGPPGTGGAHALQADPLFDAQGATGYELLSNSPCIDAGHPDAQYNDPDGSRSDIGALPYGGTSAVDGLSVPGTPQLIATPSVTRGIVALEVRDAGSIENGALLSVYAVNGVLQQQTEVYRTHTTLDLRALSAGMYILRMVTGEGPALTKVLLMR